VKKMKKKLLLFAICLSFVVGSAACAAAATKRIAYLAPGLDLPFWRYLANGIENHVKDLGLDATVQVYDSKNDSSIQLQNAQDAIVKQVDVIIISPTDSSSCPAVLNAAERAGIPAIIADVGTDSGKYAAFIITPNEAGAKEVADYLGRTMVEKNMTDRPAAQITISLARNNGKARSKGFSDAMAAVGVDVVDVRQLEKYTRAEAEGFAQDLLTAYQNLGAIFCHTDEPTLGVVKAVQSSGRDVLVVGFDATPETIDAVRDGTLLAVAVQQPAYMGMKAVESAVAIFEGKDVSAQVDVPTLLVTMDNVNDKDIADQLATNVFPDKK
jgi:ABC-type sugar transport system substrate-binding protein